jgi:hypothetical protein
VVGWVGLGMGDGEGCDSESSALFEGGCVWGGAKSQQRVTSVLECTRKWPPLANGDPALA